MLCGQVSHLFSLVERLDLPLSHPPTRSITPSTDLVEILGLFTATRSLRVNDNILPLIAPVLIGAGATEVLPNLRDLLLEEMQS
jgi:hypothetical protein